MAGFEVIRPTARVKEDWEEFNAAHKAMVSLFSEYGDDVYSWPAMTALKYQGLLNTYTDIGVRCDWFR